MSKYFNKLEVYPQSKKLFFHNAITTVCGGPCGLLNPNYVEALSKVPKYSKTILASKQEIIEFDKSLVTIKSTTIVPAKRRGLGTQILFILSLKLRYAEKEQQVIDQQIVDRKT